MEELPPVGEKRLFPYNLSVYPFLLDHRIPSGAILPAVHSMQLLVDFVDQVSTEFDTSTLINASFGKLLHLTDDQESIETWIEVITLSESQLRLALLTKSKSKSGIVRSYPHAAFEITKAQKRENRSVKLRSKKHHYQQQTLPDVIPGLTRNLNRRFWITGFGHRIKSGITRYLKRRKSNSILHESNRNESIPVSDIYPGLVSFDKGFQNVVEPVATNEFGAATKVSGGNPFPGPSILGSPFPLDAAFQAACAWGRKYTQRVCYPVAFEKRIVLQPTQANEIYKAEINLLKKDGGTLEFALSLRNSQGQVMEQVEGLKMREIGIGQG